MYHGISYTMYHDAWYKVIYHSTWYQMHYMCMVYGTMVRTIVPYHTTWVKAAIWYNCRPVNAKLE